MKTTTKIIFLFFIIISASIEANAQTIKSRHLPPIKSLAKVKIQKPAKVEQLLFRGAIELSFFEMTLFRTGGELSGSYFYVKYGRAKSLKLRGSIDDDGKFFLREFNRADEQTGEFRGVLGEKAGYHDLYMDGGWKNSRRKSLGFYAAGQVISFTGGQRIETREFSEKNKSKRFEVNVEYPEIIGGNAAARKFNLLAKDLALESVAEFRERMLRQTDEELKNSAHTGNNFGVSYDLKFADDNFVGVQFFLSEFSGGMPEPVHRFEDLNYDLKNNRTLNLADLFKPGANYLERISAYCLKELQSRPPVNGVKLLEGEWAKGASPDENNFRNWNLMNKGLLITFDVYQIAPKYGGMSYVFIPYSKLVAFAKSGGAIKKIMQKENLQK